MPEDIELIKGIISRLSPEQAKQVAENMDRMSARRGIFALVGFMFLIGLMIILSCITASACGNYEECTEMAKKYETADSPSWEPNKIASYYSVAAAIHKLADRT